MTEFQPAETDFPGNAQTADLGDLVADPHLSIAAAARALRISPTTLRRYIKDYSDHLDVVRDGRKSMVAVSSIPALAQIRDLRARKFGREDIQRLLVAVPGQVTLEGLADSIESTARNAVQETVDAALGDLRTEIASLKQATLDSDVVVRQSLANILFLIEKFGKELQFHVSEERIASNERDLRMTRNENELHLLMAPQNDKTGLLYAALAFCRRVSTALFSR
jgi:DNA-binding transcriptional LysR family regulator